MKWIFSGLIFLFISIAVIFFTSQKPSQKGNFQRVKNYQEKLMGYSNDIFSLGERRHPNSEGLKATREYLKNYMDSLSLEIFVDSFSQDTPVGETTFENIIGKYHGNKDSDEITILAAHYESKVFEDFEFLGATDSVVPCAMILHLMEFITTKSIKKNFWFIFFDGEEAFVEWTKEDSLYGSRHLAEQIRIHRNFTIEKPNAFILLDLIGEKGVQFTKFMHNSGQAHTIYDQLTSLENFLYEKNSFFPNKVNRFFIDDDHSPFMQFKIPIVHLISVPFPKCWHKETDTPENIDYESVNEIQNILTTFFLF